MEKKKQPVKESKEKSQIKEKSKEKQVSKSVKGMYHYLSQAWKKMEDNRLRELMVGWRAGKRLTKIPKPTRLDRARAVGYKAKKGFVVIRAVIKRGGRRRTVPNKKRMTKKQGVKKVLKMNYQWVAEQRCQKRYTNLNVLNSYMVGQDGKYYVYEVIMVDPERPEIKNDPTINWICRSDNKKRAFRGLTSAAKKSRGLRHKSHNLKIRPSLRSWNRKGK